MANRQDSKSSNKQDGTMPSGAAPTVTLGDPKDLDEGPTSTRRLGGSMFKSLNNVLANQALQVLWLGSKLSDKDKDTRYNAALSALMEFEPADAIEGMMAVQAVGLHSASVECMRRAMIPEQSGQATDNLRKQAANMTRAFLDVVAALDRKRGKGGQQVVRVERVMIGPGGQAVVGNVTTAAESGMGQQGGGVGCGTGTEGEPHTPPAQLAHDVALGSILPPMRSADTGRDALPVASDAQRAVPDARRA